jgi:PAS domain S-box-containing protein
MAKIPPKKRARRQAPARPRSRNLAVRLEAAQEALGVVTWYWVDGMPREKWYGDLSPLFGLPASSIASSREEYVKALHPDDVAESHARLARCLRGEIDHWHAEERVVWPDGSIHWLEAYGRGRYENGRTVELAGVVREISELRAMRESVRQSSEKYRAVFETSPDGISVTRLADGVLIEANDAATRGMGRERDPVIGKPVPQLGVWADPGMRARIAQELAEYGKVHNVSTTLLRGDGTPVQVLLSAQRLEIDGVPCALWSWRDVTDLRRTEAQLMELNASLEQRVTERTAALQSANEELEGFSYTISHDLRAPARAVSSFAELLRTQHAAQLGPEGLRLLGRIEDNGKRMSQLIADLLEFTRTGRAVLRLETVDMGALAQQIADDLGAAARPSPVVEIGSLPPARCDPSLLRQVWSNLIGNAVKFSGRVGKPRIRIEGRRKGAMLEYSVADNGAGFDMAYAGKLFGVFQRLHSNDEFEGSGVGLAIVQRIVKKHGGQVEAEGAPGRGATLRFTLPA